MHADSDGRDDIPKTYHGWHGLRGWMAFCAAPAAAGTPAPLGAADTDAHSHPLADGNDHPEHLVWVV